MAPVVISGTLQIRIIWSLSGADWAENVLHALIGTGPAVDQAMADTIAGHVGTAHTSSGLSAEQPTSVSIDRVGIRDIRTANQALIEAPVGSAGTALGQLLPRGNALVVTNRTALAGRSYRGRTFVPGFSEDSNDVGGRASSAAQTAAAAFINDLQTAMTQSAWPLAVASITKGLSTVITQGVTRNGIWDGQRSRAFNGL